MATLSSIAGLPGLVGYWPLEETSGFTAADQSASPQNGTYMGAYALGFNGVGPSSGKAVGFRDVASGKVSIPDVGKLDVGDSFTFGIFVRKREQRNCVLFHKGAGAAPVVKIYYDGTIQLQEHTGYNLAGTTAGNGIQDCYRWHLVVATKSPGDNTGRVYVDGVDRTNSTQAGLFLNNAEPLVIGQNQVGGDQLAGVVCHAFVLNRPITSVEVATIWEQANRRPDAASRVTTKFGVHMDQHYTPVPEHDNENAKIRAVHATIARHTLLLSVIRAGATDPGTYDWATLDSVVTKQEGVGLEVLLNPAYSPQWLNGSTDPAFVPGTETVTYGPDAFSDLAGFTIAGTVTPTGGRARATYTSGYSTLTRVLGDIRGGFIELEVPTVNTNAAVVTYLKLAANAAPFDDDVSIVVDTTTIFLRRKENGVETTIATLPYVNATHLSWRIRVNPQGTEAYLDTKDGAPGDTAKFWSRRATVSLTNISLANAYAEFGAGYYGTDPGTYAEFDNFRTGKWDASDPAYTAWRDGQATLLTAAVNRYKPGGTLGTRVRKWEIWNEPNLGESFWKPRANPHQYADYFNAMRAAILAADPLAEVCTGGMPFWTGAYSGWGHGVTIPGDDFLREAVALGMADSGRVGVHPYSNNDPTGAPANHVDGSSNFDDLRKAKDTCIELGRPATQIWVTEWGWQAHTSQSLGLTEAQMGTFLADSLAIMQDELSAFIELATWFNHRDLPLSSLWYGLYTEAYGRLKPAGDAFAAFAAVYDTLPTVVFLPATPPSSVERLPRTPASASFVGPVVEGA